MVRFGFELMYLLAKSFNTIDGHGLSPDQAYSSSEVFGSGADSSTDSIN